jgi:secreted PhoX family phosphatase
MELSVTRRSFLGGTTSAGLGFVFAGAGSLEAFARPGPRPSAPQIGYGPLIPDPNGLLALPEGFSYKVVAQTGVTPVRGGGVFPSDPDGMAVFPWRGSGGGSVLICNHEIGGTEQVRVPAVKRLTYDENAWGGTSTIMVDRQGNPVENYTSVAGTDNNCAGGITPWKTWLTCEEVERRANTLVAEGTAAERRLTKDHGYVFEVDPSSQQANLDKSPIPLKFLGRYSHEAVAVDPDAHVIYLTEDAASPNGLYFRWKPPRWFEGEKGALHDLATGTDGDTAGRLQAMSCYAGDQQVPDLAAATEVGTTYRVRWIDVPDRDAVQTSIRKQFQPGEVTHSRKLEGQWWGDGGVYFVASFARKADGSVKEHDGQVWFYDPRRKSVTLKTIFGVNPTPAVEGRFDGPDNITVSPHGGLILAEDGEGLKYLIGVSSEGIAYALARNDHRNPNETRTNGEFAGPTFSRNGKILFANIYSGQVSVKPNTISGWVLAITGPWQKKRRR